jgi:hypothetical protein
MQSYKKYSKHNLTEIFLRNRNPKKSTPARIAVETAAACLGSGDDFTNQFQPYFTVGYSVARWYIFQNKNTNLGKVWSVLQ